MSAPSLEQLRWRCRRGMRELDLLLAGHLDRHGAGFDDEAHAAFQLLLAQTDMDLYDWFTGRAQPPAGPLHDLIATILAERTPRLKGVPS